VVFQAGADVKLYKRVRVRLDVKYVAGMLARAEVDHIKVRTPDLPVFDVVDVGTAKMSMWLNPLIVQLGVGMDL
jgi:outer membrane protein W